MTFGLLRPATRSDADFFYRMRTLAESRPWYGGARTEPDAHARWFTERLGNALVGLYVWEQHARPMGALRADSNGELAFDVLPGCRTQAMLRCFLETFPRRFKVTLDAADREKARLLGAAGFDVFPATLLVYRP